MFQGSSIQDITKIKRSDVFLDVTQRVVGMVTVPASISIDGTMSLGTILSSTDGGLTWNPFDSASDELATWDANGVLYNDLSESKKTTVVVTGIVKAKYLVGSDSLIQASLFKNKIIAK